MQASFDGIQQGVKATSHDQASSMSSFHNIHMNGQEVFKLAVRAVPDVRLAANPIMLMCMLTC